uniref:ANK_REP_REGION domain-containing protein n=1 Tax=Macrostomum lignano TaxID=282301 RepID=A0A1I8F4A3_9PLAT
AEAPQTAVDFPKEDQQQQQQEQQERQNSQFGQSGSVQQIPKRIRQLYFHSSRIPSSWQGNVAAVRLLLQHGCAVNAWCQLPAASALSASSSGDAAGNDRQQQQFKDPIVVARSCPTGRRAALLAAASLRRRFAGSGGLPPNQLSVASARLLAPVGRLHILPRPGLSVQFDIADRLPSLPCVLLPRQRRVQHRSRSYSGAVGSTPGRCSVREVWLNNRAPDAAESGRLFILHLPPRSVSAPTLSAWCPAGRFGCQPTADSGYWLERTKVKVLAESG